MENKPLVSIIALNYNQTPVTMDFLASMQMLTYPNYEIIIVDNASTVDPTPLIKEKYPHVRVVRPTTNLGFTGGHNLGMREAKGEYFFNVNNDTEITADCADLIERLVEPFLEDPKVGAVSPKVRYFFHPEVLEYAGHHPINNITGRGKAIGTHEVDKGQHDQSGPTWFAHGAAMMVSRKLVEEVGMFHEPFFIYYEEMDWSSRIIKAGYKIYYQHKTMLFHKSSMTMGKDSSFKAYYFTRNRILYMRRHANMLQFMGFMLFFVGLVAPKTLATYLLKGQKEHLRSFVRAIKWHFAPPAGAL
jgi:GT2 family glycosyltransferase